MRWASWLPGLLGLLAVCGATGSATAEDALQRVRQSGQLRVAIDASYPPMEFEVDNQPVGYDVDFARELAHRLGVEARLVVRDWSAIVAGLQSGEYDVIISSMNVTEDRMRQMNFVEYLALGQVFVCRPAVAVRDERDLEGKVVAVQVNTTSHSWAEGLDGKGIRVGRLDPYPLATNVFQALSAGQADVAIVDEPVGRYYAHRDGSFVVSGRAMEPKPIGVALKKQDRDLRDAVAAAVHTIKDDGTMKRLAEQWFGQEPGQLRAADAGFWGFSWEVVLPQLFQGLLLTLQLTVISGLLGIVLGLGLALVRVSRHRLPGRLVLVYVTLFRGTPLLLQIFFVFYALPPLLGVRLEAWSAGILALTLNNAAYVCEIFRAAIQSIDKGQMEAARALGMSYAQAMRSVVLPQAWRRLLPVLVNELAGLSKDTSLVSVLAVHEMLYQTNRLAAAYLRPWEVYVWAAFGYLVLVLALTALARRLEKRLEARES
jgi:His/Glu/Gln/Arg/opine family amino acid ABC transporter permease subunit